MWWPKWRLVVKGHWSPSEIDTWTLGEVYIANDTMDMQMYFEQQALQEARKPRSRE